jgi:hypothetical protein
MTDGVIDFNQMAQAKAFKQLELEAQKDVMKRAQDLQAAQNVATICQNLLVSGDKAPDVAFVADAQKAAAQYLTTYIADALDKFHIAKAQLAPDEEYVRV